MLTYQDVRRNEDINTYIKMADRSLGALGFTEHSFAHVAKVSATAKYIMETMGCDERDIELAMIAGYLHDIGNLVNRTAHSQSGAIMAFRILDKLNMPADENVYSKVRVFWPDKYSRDPNFVGNNLACIA